MRVSEMPIDSFASFDNMQIWRTKEDEYVLALREHRPKIVSGIKIDIKVKPSTREDFATEFEMSKTDESK